MDLDFLECGGVCGFSQTTPELFEQKMKCIAEAGPSDFSKYRFVSVGMPSKLLVKRKGVMVEYQILSQREQYEFIYNKLNNKEFYSFNSALILFEQTKSANIHFHAFMHVLENDHDIKAEFYDCFDIRKGKNVRHFIDIQPIRDMKGLINYLFNKDVKAYENVDQSKFKPLKSIALKPKKKIEIEKEDNNSLSIEI